jgi:cysteine desulfurase
VLLGQGAPRIANTVCVRFGERDAEQVLGKLERAGVLASSGAACGAGSTQPSHVMLAMGLTPVQAKAEVRFSLGRDTTADDIAQALAAVRERAAAAARGPPDHPCVGHPGLTEPLTHPQEFP